MNENHVEEISSRSFVYDALVVMAACVVVIAGVRAATLIVVPMLMSIFIAVIISAILTKLRDLGIGTTVAVLLIICFLGFAGIGMAIIMGPTIEELLQSDLQQKLRLRQVEIIAWLKGRGVEFADELGARYMDVNSPVKIFQQLLKSLSTVLNYTLIVFLMLAFLMWEWSRFGEKIKELPGDTQKNVVRVAEVMKSIRQYMLIKTFVSVLTGIMIAVWLYILGVKYALLWGMVAFLLNFIPTIGSLVAGIVPTFFTLVTEDNIAIPIHVAIAFLAVNGLVGNVLEPRIMGEGLGLSTFFVFVSLIFWGWVLGPAGMLLAVPLTMTIKIGLAHDPRTAWIANFLGAGIGTNRLDST